MCWHSGAGRRVKLVRCVPLKGLLDHPVEVGLKAAALWQKGVRPWHPAWSGDLGTFSTWAWLSVYLSALSWRPSLTTSTLYPLGYNVYVYLICLPVCLHLAVCICLCLLIDMTWQSLMQAMWLMSIIFIFCCRALALLCVPETGVSVQDRHCLESVLLCFFLLLFIIVIIVTIITIVWLCCLLACQCYHCLMQSKLAAVHTHTCE